jgi:hypothetical protein
MSGTKAGRPGLPKALEALREGDTVVVWELDRLGHSLKDLLDSAGGLTSISRDISIVVPLTLTTRHSATRCVPPWASV